ncbi:unnamed protein product [Rotaria sp. Silwood1]|nr:unnamed protein product [Rotaria sp. Silwood1]
MQSIITTNITADMENQTQNLTPNIKCENKIIYKTDTNGEQEQPDKTVQSETQTNQYKSFFAGCSLGSENFEFARWMDSRDDSYSLWSTEKHRYQLLSYIGKIYGQKHNIRHVLAPLRIGFNKLGAQNSLREWQLQTRPDHRIVEIKAMFEFNRTCPSSLGDLKMSSSSSDLKEIINRASINAYFDMICRDGSTTAEIGEYLNLTDNQVDLITCFVTLHHVPHLEPILAEFVRILRSGGYLIIREHDCKKVHSLTAKYLNFVHAFMMIARVGEFADSRENNLKKDEVESDDDSVCHTTEWKQQKLKIIQYTSSIQYRTRAEWQQKIENAGFRLKATLDYDLKITSNPQALYYAVFQLTAK